MIKKTDVLVSLILVILNSLIYSELNGSLYRSSVCENRTAFYVWHLSFSINIKQKVKPRTKVMNFDDDNRYNCVTLYMPFDIGSRKITS